MPKRNHQKQCYQYGYCITVIVNSYRPVAVDYGKAQTFSCALSGVFIFL